MKKFLFVLLLGPICFLAVADSHALYLATIQIRAMAEDDVEVQVKVFADDLQDVLRNHSEEFKPAPVANTVSENHSLTESYFQEKLLLKINGIPLRFSLMKGEPENDAFVLTFHAVCSEDKWKQLEVVADFFTELFPDQSNVLILSYEGARQFERFNQTNKSSIFTFD